jgi:hypothetical protein
MYTANRTDLLDALASSMRNCIETEISSTDFTLEEYFRCSLIDRGVASTRAEMIALRMAEGDLEGLAYHVASCDPHYLRKLIQAEPRLIHMLLQNNLMSDLDVKIVENEVLK